MMHEWHIQARKERGREIAERFKDRIKQKGGVWFVPSSKARKNRYKVNLDPTNISCSCPDHQETGERCKHIFAVEYLLRGGDEAGIAPVPAPTPPKPVKPTIQRNWREYNDTQTKEEDEFEPLLHTILQSVPEPEHERGRRPVPLRDALFAAISKVYLGRSARRAMTRLNRAYEAGYLSKPVCFSTITACLESASTTAILNDLIVRSSLPVVPIERVFAVDSTGFAGSRFVRWQDIKYRGNHEHIWAKMHIMVGTRSHIITAVAIKERDAADLGQLPELLRTTAQHFTIREVVADRVYNTVRNQEEIAEIGARAYIPFKSSHTGRRGGIWKEKFQQWHDNLDESLDHYHKRVQVEAAFSMMKAKFGDSLRSKHELPMKNEALCKALCHNLHCLIRLMYSHKIGIEFFTEVFEKHAAD
jgi:transposase